MKIESFAQSYVQWLVVANMEDENDASSAK